MAASPSNNTSGRPGGQDSFVVLWAVGVVAGRLLTWGRSQGQSKDRPSVPSWGMLGSKYALPLGRRATFGHGPFLLLRGEAASLRLRQLSSPSLPPLESLLGLRRIGLRPIGLGVD